MIKSEKANKGRKPLTPITANFTHENSQPCYKYILINDCISPLKIKLLFALKYLIAYFVAETLIICPVQFLKAFFFCYLHV